jgi:hypothetical protein
MSGGSPVPTAGDSADGPLSDVVAEAARLLDSAGESGLEVRLLGGVAIAMRVSPGEPPFLPREYRDIDLIVGRGTRAGVDALMLTGGYRADPEFNALNGHRRLLYYDDGHGRQVDVFVGGFSMCHTIPLGDRLFAEPRTLPLSELLLTKLQVVELNEKDQSDILSVLYHHDVGDRDGDMINGSRVGEICAKDWGLFRTVELNIERSTEALRQRELGEQASGRLASQLGKLSEWIQTAPKSAKWKMRARVGDRVRWYEQPEEVG